MTSAPPPTPIPLPPDEAPPLLLLFGGTFDPVHRGHIELPLRVRDELERRVDPAIAGQAWLIYIPAARSPHKSAAPSATDTQRIDMLRLALDGHPRIAIWTDEIDRATAAPSTPSYTLDTLTRARAWLDSNNAQHTSLRLLIGADQALGFHRWREPRDILRLAPPAVMIRGDVADADELLARLGQTGFWKRHERDLWQNALIPVGRLDISATRIREALRTNDQSELARALPPQVANYIQSHALYTQP